MRTQEELLEEARAAIEQRAEEQWARYAVLAEVAEMVEGKHCNQFGHSRDCPKMGHRNNYKASYKAGYKAGNVLVPNNRNARESGGNRPKEPFTPNKTVQDSQSRRPKDRQKNYLPKSEEDLPDGTDKRIAETVQDSSKKMHDLCPVKNVRAYDIAIGREHRNITIQANSDTFRHIDRRHGPGNEKNHNQIPLGAEHYENVVRTVRNPDSVTESRDEKYKGRNRFEAHKEISGTKYVAIVTAQTEKNNTEGKCQASVQIVTCWAEYTRKESPRKKRRRRK